MSLEQPARAAAPVNANTVGTQIFPDQQISTNPVVIAVPGSGRLEQKKFRVLASGYATTAAATTTFQAGFFVGQSLTVGNNTSLGLLTATVINAATAPWWIEASLVFDSVSGKLQGQFAGMINNTIEAAAVLTNVVTGINGTNAPAGTEPVFNLVIGIAFGVNASIANVAHLGQFILLQP